MVVEKFTRIFLKTFVGRWFRVESEHFSKENINYFLNQILKMNPSKTNIINVFGCKVGESEYFFKKNLKKVHQKASKVPILLFFSQIPRRSFFILPSLLGQSSSGLKNAAIFGSSREPSPLELKIRLVEKRLRVS